LHRRPGLLVVVEMGVTVPLLRLTKQAVFPFGVIAISKGSSPTLIGFPAVLVAVETGIAEFRVMLMA
jgi:hypothetical protein